MTGSPTNWKLYSDNAEAWEAMLKDCSKAEKSIVLEQFIFVNDDFGRKLIDVCVERASKGVRVRFLWDAAGSFTVWGSNLASELRDKGIELLFWRTLIPGYYKVPDYRSWYFRNHRRTLVIDDKIGYTGSICVIDRYKNWRDTNLRIEGPVVVEMSGEFERMWSRAKKTNKLEVRKQPKSAEFRYVTNYPAPGRRQIYKETLHAIIKARRSVYITTPYFVPTLRLARAIRKAAERGVDVRLLIPERSNYFAVDLGARGFFHALLSAGVRIYLHTGNMLHSKTMSVDTTWATVGSMNMDSVSLLYNFEANIVTTNDDFSREVEQHFMRDIGEAREITLQEWQKRSFLEKIPEYLIRLVTKFL